MEATEEERLFKALLESDKIKNMYDTYIIKEIPYETWVKSMMEYLLQLR